MIQSLPTRHFPTRMMSVIMALGFLFHISAWAASEAIGTLSEAQGRVEINGTPASTGAELRLGMRVVTGADGQATLQFLDDQIIHLDPNSVFWVKNYHYAKDKPKENRSTAELLKGGMRFISGTMSKESPEAIRIDTPVATIGIRGTEFVANLDSGLYLQVFDGAVMVTAAGQTVTALAGQAITVTKTGSPPTVGPAAGAASAAGPSATTGVSTPVSATAKAATTGATGTATSATTGATGATGTAGTAGASGAAAGAASTVSTTTIITAGAAAAAAGAAVVNQTQQEDPKTSP